MRNKLTWLALTLSVACGTNTETVYLPYTADVVTGSDATGQSDAVSGCDGGCTPGVKHCNADGIVETCLDPDGDGCGAWGNPTPCATGQACSEGQCAIGCTDKCDVQGSRQCNGDKVESCRDHDGNGCLEWGSPVECTGGTTCQSGFCSVACAGSPECTVQGAKKCDTGGVSACADLDFDGCLNWTDPTPCPNGQVCSNGGCSNDCSDECTVVGARQCQGPNSYALCGQGDSDECLEWGTATECASGETCSNGFCQKGCTAECTVVGASRCSGTSVQTCGDANADGCLEWGTAVPCDTGLVCSNGYCSVTCSDECTVSGARICDTGGVKECGDTNGDGCLEWGTVVPCEAGQTCSNGQCGTGCTDECSVQGARRCLGAAVQTCGNTDTDACLEWGTATGCGANESCSNGFCSTSCTDECEAIGASACDGDAVRTCVASLAGCLAYGQPVPCDAGLSCSAGKCASTCTDECTVQGAKKCVGTGVAVCGNSDIDACLEWGSAVPCGDALTCSGGFCTSACTDECTVQGAKACDTTGVITCDDKNGDGCLEWSTGVACPSGNSCSNGTCSSSCTDECGPAGSKRCQGTGVQTCGNTDADACLEWGTAVPCGASQTCSGGACALGCADECTVKGARQCAAATTYQICDDKNGDGCLELGTATACGSGEVCANGSCALTCVNECPTSGSKRCNTAGTGVEACGEFDGDGCLEWGAAVVCASGQVCNSGACTLTCTNACPTSGATRCNTGNTGVETCGDKNTDGCLEWSSAVSCASGQVCSSGSCALTCTNACNTAGATRCSVGNTGVETCGDKNADGCLEWSSAVACGATATCTSGACADVAVPGNVVINEILYDDASTDTSAFIEFKGPANLDLTGFQLVGVNGTNGADYGAITLQGSIGADGLFVVASPTSTSGILTAADQLSALADYQNGPDSVQLRWGKTVADAVGYGTFTSAIFAGEGTPAVDVNPGQSLGRNSASADTGDNSKDFFAYGTPTPGAANGAANAPPTAKITCPATGKTGTAITVDGSQSSDTDGTIAKYSFDWGDSYNSTGPTASASRTYTSPGSYTITLTVTDSGGATASATCIVPVGDALAPAVFIVTPAADVQVTQGTVVTGIAADATPAPGRTISSVQLIVDGVAVGSPDTTAPYTFTYTVPALAVTDTSLLVQARATDSTGATGTSAVRKLNVKNDKPVASLSAVISGNLQVTVDATGCSDTETLAADLEVRFDWEADGTWDTAYGKTKTATHTYTVDGAHSIKMEVKDGVGQLSSATRTVNFQSVLDVSGNVTTTLWYGTINITGDVTVPTGETLTIAPGTTIVFLEFDQDANGVGDFDLFVNGTLKTNGTPTDPVIITALDTNGVQNASSWGTIRLSGTGGNVLNNTIIEWGDTALDLRASTAMTGVEIRKSKVGLAMSSAGITGSGIAIHDNTTDGVVANGATFTLTNVSATKNGKRGLFVTAGGASQLQSCVVDQNVSHGVEMDGSTLGFDTCSVQSNGGTGLYYRGAAKGLCTHSTIRTNAYEGVRAHWSTSGNPTPTINYNNIFENGAQGSMTTASTSLAAASSASSSGTYTSSTYTAPSSGQILLVDADYSDGYSSSITGQILNATSSSVLRSFTDTTTRTYIDVSGNAVSAIKAQVLDNYAYDAGTVSVYTVAHTKGPTKQITTLLWSSVAGVIDVRHNYVGTWPKVLDNVTYAQASAIKLGGFVSTPFAASFDTTNHWGEVDITSPTTWSTDVYLTGVVTVKSGGTLTIGPGVKVIAVPTDTDGDGLGDWRIDRAGGTVAVNGTAALPVAFSALVGAPADLPAKGGYVGLGASSAGTTIATYATFLDSSSAVIATGGGTTTLTDVTVDAARQDGLTISETLNATRLTVKNGLQNGLVLSSGTLCKSVDGLLADANVGFGLVMTSATCATNLVTNSTFTNNTAGAGNLINATVALKQSNLKFNGWGLFVSGTTAGSVTACNIQSNTREGVFVGPASSSNPTMSFTGNNIFGNTQAMAVTKVNAALTAASSASSSGTYTSSTYTAPASASILYFQSNFSDGYSSSISASVQTAGGAVLRTFTDTTGDAWYDIALPGVTSIKGVVADNYAYDAGTIGIPTLLQLTATTPAVEFGALRTTSGKLVATGNYWGVTVPTATQVIEHLTATIDYTAFKTTAISGTGPQ